MRGIGRYAEIYLGASRGHGRRTEGDAVIRYTVLLDPDPDGEGYTVTVPVLRGCITEGRTIDEALVNARQAIACLVEGLIVSGDGVPREEPPLIALVVEVEVRTPLPALAG